MVLKDAVTGKGPGAIIEPVTAKDFQVIKKSRDRFDKFEWSRYAEYEVYKIRLENDKTILGLMCLTEHTDKATNAIEIELLEVASENIGNHKKLDNIAGCLIAYACRESFKRGYDGFVFLTPKTSLLKHYRTKYGFEHFAFSTGQRPDGFMFLHDDSARKLIKKYLE